MAKKRFTVTIDADLLQDFRKLCKKVHFPTPNYSAATEEAIQEWVSKHSAASPNKKRH
jgi:metal-responsive CopG/Arc/MetJ family transcriptional regulator